MAGLGACCMSGTLAVCNPQGTEAKLGGVLAYIAKPSRPTTRAIVICSDIFGYTLTNTRLIADAMAMEGFLTVVPDMFGNKPLDVSLMDTLVILTMGERQSSTWWSWATWPLRAVRRIAHLLSNMLPFALKHFPPTTKTGIISAAITDLRSDHGIKSVGVAGYCFGGGPALQLACTDAVDAFVVAHAMIKVPQDLDSLKKPGMVVCADNDSMCSDKVRKQMEAVLGKRQDVAFKVQFYPGTFHGFATRGDDKDPKIQAAKVDALKQTLDWFQTHLKE